MLDYIKRDEGSGANSSQNLDYRIKCQMRYV
jgi:hypothetical protein